MKKRLKHTRRLFGYRSVRSTSALFIAKLLLLMLMHTEGYAQKAYSHATVEHLSSVAQEDEWWKTEAKNMVRMQIEQRGIEDARVLEVMRTTPRHRFVPSMYSGSAYSDSPLPIGQDQTISQPYIVALMTTLLDVDETHKVLEIGTGSGYQAAILAGLAGEVYTIEVLKELARSAESRLSEMGYHNVHVKWGDGYKGWPAHAPFDRIIVTAAPQEVPQALVEQLKPGGKLVLPVGDQYQVLKVITKDAEGEVRERTITGVRFVPMIHPDKSIETEEE